MSDAPVPQETIFTIGPTLVGSLISYCVLGISIMQLYLYHLYFPNDQRWIKTLVYTVVALDVFQSVVVAENCWHSLVSGWGREEDLLFPGWSFIALPIVSGTVALMVQSFYAWRIYLLGKWKIVPGVIIFFGMASCAGACAISFGFIPLKDLRLLHKPNMTARTYVWLGGAALTDVIISLSMLYLLFGARQSKFGRTQRLINRLIRLTIETGVVTATTASLELILFLTLPSTNSMHLVPALNLCKVYANALLASLNSRATNSKNFNQAGSLSTDGTLQWSSVGSPRAFETNTGNTAVVHIQKTSNVLEMENVSDRGGKPKGIDFA
ncbi:hypothetical protein D9756_005762 [Leucocoprinus leucothites]|uniref:DUF6534 domain-containing protein n=1 Tax=Leucocoprinus leucothites TaxID=201217 RepID=A0A8H5CNM0_9AGAR|nr:hypothetical protein D9756_011510 [Leucoagaricus leucothites]KAF5354786.1 hypothetical protein D9756_005762 [Leucoagaricus leucothites]